jgi:hypothetical protein
MSGFSGIVRLPLTGRLAITAGFAFVAVLVWLATRLLFAGDLALGSTVPSILYSTSSGCKELYTADSTKLVLMFFHRGCRFCCYELDEIDSKIGAFSEVKMVFLTTERTFFKSDYSARWTRLAASEQVEWGIIKKDKFETAFGTRTVPCFFFFDESGILYEKLCGEVRPGKILEIIKR